MSADRSNLLRAWLGRALDDEFTLSALPVEASSRRFHRVQQHGRTYIAMDSPPQTENNEQFVALSAVFRSKGIPVPAVVAHDLETGFMLVDDLGDDTFEKAYARGETCRPLELAVRTLVEIQGVVDGRIPPYTVERFRTELDIFRDWILGALIGATGGPLDDLADTLVAATQAQPQVTVHRDFHSRNLILKPDATLGIVDFQDALVGPVTYDLASLLHDCYHAFERGTIDAYVDRYRENAAAAGVATIEDRSRFMRAFELTALQRQLKAAGIFARLRLDRGRASHLRDIVPVLGRAALLAAGHDDLRASARWLTVTVLPRVQAALEKLE